MILIYRSVAMIRRKKDGIEWLELEIFQPFPEVVHAFFLRHGGCSEAPYGSLNFSTLVGDKIEHAQENRRRALKALGINKLATCCFVHGKEVHPVQHATSHLLKEGDGLITDDQGLGLLSTFADCQPALFFDPVKKVIANIHSGWRGNVSGIYKEAVLKFIECFNSDPKDILVGVGPSLGPARAEFIHYKKELPESFWKYKRGECHFDLWKITRSQLEDAGILPHHIEMAGLCTYDNPNDFFSHRRDKVTGRNAAVISLR